jgi:hypothetical protein
MELPKESLLLENLVIYLTRNHKTTRGFQGVGMELPKNFFFLKS